MFIRPTHKQQLQLSFMICFYFIIFVTFLATQKKMKCKNKSQQRNASEIWSVGWLLMLGKYWNHLTFSTDHKTNVLIYNSCRGCYYDGSDSAKPSDVTITISIEFYSGDLEIKQLRRKIYMFSHDVWLDGELCQALVTFMMLQTRTLHSSECQVIYAIESPMKYLDQKRSQPMIHVTIFCCCGLIGIHRCALIPFEPFIWLAQFRKKGQTDKHRSISKHNLIRRWRSPILTKSAFVVCSHLFIAVSAWPQSHFFLSSSSYGTKSWNAHVI